MFARMRVAATIAAATCSLLLCPRLTSGAPADEAEALPSPLSLPDVLAAVRRRNPAVSARRLEAAAASLRPRAEGLPPDPMLELSWWQQPLDFASTPLMLTVRQTIPWRSRLRLSREAAEREGRLLSFEADDVLRRAEAEAKRAYFDLRLAEESMAVNDRVRGILEHVVEVTEARYRVGKAVQADVLRAQSERLVVDNERLDLERARDEAIARLNGLLDRPADAPLPPTLPAGQPQPLPPATVLLARALAERPELRRAAEVIRAAEARAALARTEGLPDVAAFAGYMVNVRGVDTFTLGLSSTLPFSARRRQAALTSAADAEVRAARQQLEAARRQAEVELRAALLQLETAARHTRLHAEKLVPLSDLAMESAQASYETGKVDLLAVLEAARAVRLHHLDHARFLADYWRRLAELELAVGVDLDDEVGGDDAHHH